MITLYALASLGGFFTGAGTALNVTLMGNAQIYGFLACVMVLLAIGFGRWAFGAPVLPAPSVDQVQAAATQGQVKTGLQILHVQSYALVVAQHRMAAALQTAADQTLGRRGARLLIGTVMVV